MAKTAQLLAPRATKLFEDAQPYAALAASSSEAAPPSEAPAEPPAPAPIMTEAPAPVVSREAPAPAPASAPVMTPATGDQAKSDQTESDQAKSDQTGSAPSVAETAPEPQPEHEPEHEPEPLDPERRVLAGDAAFHADRRRGLLLLGAGLWIALGAGALVATILAPLDLRGLAVAVGVGLAAYAVAAAITSLLLDRALERKLAEIRRIARIGCERVRVDDVALVRPALRDVLGEWLHIQFFIRRHRETNLWFMWGYGAQSALTLGLLALVPWSMWVAEPWFAVALLASAALLTLAHAVVEIRRLARQRRALVLEDANDPTEFIAARMVGLLQEVKDLRKHGRHDG
ncbi:MAG: hypothetical protein AAFR16_12725 [Pseudomonadota bacterium]